MAEMFGTAGGVRLWEQDQLAQIKATVDATHRLGQIAMQPQEQLLLEQQTEQARQHARAYGANADADLAKVAEQRKLAEIAMRIQSQTEAVIPGVKPMSELDKMGRLASTVAAAGMPLKALEIHDKVASIRQKESSALSSLANTELRKIQTFAAEAELVGQIFSNPDIKDDESFWRANRLLEMRTGQPSDFRLPGGGYRPYDAGLVRQVISGSKAGLEQAKLEQARIVQTEREAQNRITNRTAAENRHIREEQLALNKRVLDLRAKAEGGRAPSIEPRAAEIDQVKRMMVADYPGLEKADGVLLAKKNEAAYGIASEARALMQADRKLGPQAAISRAYSAALGRGDIEFKPGGWGGYGKELKYSGMGRIPETAIPVPQPAGESAKAREDAVAKRQVGKYYILPNGSIGKWTKSGGKTGWLPVAPREDADNRTYPSVLPNEPMGSVDGRDG